MLVGPFTVCEAHPRVGGENLGADAGLLVGQGSSPRRRGKLKLTGLGPFSVGLIPA